MSFLLQEGFVWGCGYRTYPAGDVARLVFIRSAQRLGLSLDEVREVLALRDSGERPCGYVLELVARELGALDRRIAEMVALRGELRDLLDETNETPGTGDDGFCRLIEHHTAAQ